MLPVACAAKGSASGKISCSISRQPVFVGLWALGSCPNKSKAIWLQGQAWEKMGWPTERECQCPVDSSLLQPGLCVWYLYRAERYDKQRAHSYKEGGCWGWLACMVLVQAERGQATLVGPASLHSKVGQRAHQPALARQWGYHLPPVSSGVLARTRPVCLGATCGTAWAECRALG